MKTKIIENKPAGTYTDVFILEYSEIVKDWEFAPYYDGNYVMPLWNGSEYYEGATPEEIEIFENQKIEEYLKKINAKVANLYESALMRSIGKSYKDFSENKEERNRQIQIQREQYELKKENAEKLLADLPINEISLNLLNYEIERDFANGKLEYIVNQINKSYTDNQLPPLIDINLTPLKKYASLILFKYNSGNAMFTTFKEMIENFRSKLITNLDYKEFSIIDDRFIVVDNIHSETTIEEIFALNNQFNAL